MEVGKGTIGQRTPILTSKSKGIWDAYEILTMSTMGESLKNTVLTERNRIESLIAFSSSFFAENKRYFEKGSKEYEMMEQMTLSLVNAFEKRLPISEDLLFLLWKWSTQITGGRPLESLLGKVLFKTLENILVIPLNAFDWLWFKASLLHSAVKLCLGFFVRLFFVCFFFLLFAPIWLEPGDRKENRILFDLLLDVCEKALKKQKEQLIKEVSAIQENEKEGWERMISYKEVNINGSTVRQDFISDEKSEENLVRYPLLPYFEENELRNLGVSKPTIPAHISPSFPSSPMQLTRNYWDIPRWKGPLSRRTFKRCRAV